MCSFAFYVSGTAGRLSKYFSGLSEKKISKERKSEFSFVLCDEEQNNALNTICKELGVPVFFDSFTQHPKELRAELLSQRLLSLLCENKVDYLFVFGKRILKGELLEHYKNRIINFHPAVLPAFPGRKAIDQAREYGSFLFGNTAHFIDSGIDTGPIIMQSLRICNSFDNYDTILDEQIPMLVQIIQWIEKGRLIVNDRTVRIQGARYELNRFVPNLEFTTID